MQSYSYDAESLVRDYFLADSFVPCTSILTGIFMCKIAYDITQFISLYYFKFYASLTKIKQIEWNNRGISTAHAIFITAMSLYLIFFSNLYSESHDSNITLRSSNLSNFSLGVSIGYFITDLAMIFWFYPLLGEMEYVCHHLLSLCAITYAVMTNEGQIYTYMVLISEATTPLVNLRWFLDTGGMKRSNTYLMNGVLMLILWLVARILMFVYLFYHIFLHYDQIEEMHTFGYILVFAVPGALTIMNVMWFGKILKGLRKQLAKRQ